MPLSLPRPLQHALTTNDAARYLASSDGHRWIDDAARALLRACGDTGPSAARHDQLASAVACVLRVHGCPARSLRHPDRRKERGLRETARALVQQLPVLPPTHATALVQFASAMDTYTRHDPMVLMQFATEYTLYGSNVRALRHQVATLSSRCDTSLLVRLQEASVWEQVGVLAKTQSLGYEVADLHTACQGRWNTYKTILANDLRSDAPNGLMARKLLWRLHRALLRICAASEHDATHRQSVAAEIRTRINVQSLVASLREQERPRQGLGRYLSALGGFVFSSIVDSLDADSPCAQFVRKWRRLLHSDPGFSPTVWAGRVVDLVCLAESVLKNAVEK